MQVIIDFLSGIGDLISAAFDWLITSILDLAHIASMLTQVVANVPAYFAWLPDECASIFAVILSVVVLYKILGREG